MGVHAVLGPSLHRPSGRRHGDSPCKGPGAQRCLAIRAAELREVPGPGRARHGLQGWAFGSVSWPHTPPGCEEAPPFISQEGSGPLPALL